MIACQTGKYEDAAQYIERAIRVQGSVAFFHNNLGEAYRALGRISQGIDCWRRALELQPDYAEAHNNLGNALKDQGKLVEALACYRRALELKPDYAVAHDNLLCTLQYCADVTPAGLAAAHADYDRRHAAPLRGRWRRL